jgi:hypothetical protein
VLRARAAAPPDESGRLAVTVGGLPAFDGPEMRKPGAWPGLLQGFMESAVYALSAGGGTWSTASAFAASTQNSSRTSVVDR